MARVTRVVPPLPQTERGVVCQITADSPGERIVYCNGTNVLWRSIASMTADEKPEDVFTWKGHTKKTTVAAMSPNSQWVVSGDVGGAIRVWGAKGDNVLKNEYKLWDGTIKDASWSSDSTRIVACGDGKETRAVAILADTGSKTGEVAGHSKQINSISFRSQRPFRVVTGSEDMLVAFHQGPPFKYAKSHTTHTNFVNCVRFSPDGAFALSAGSDAKLVLFEGKEGDLVKEFEKPDGISGSLWAAVWSPDGSKIATAGGDKKLRVWDREAGKQVAEAAAGSALEDMLLGLVWPTASRIITVCLDGRLMLWDVDAAGVLTAAGAVDGTQGPLSCVACDPSTGALIQGGGDGFVASVPSQGAVSKAKIGKGIQHILAHSPAFSGAAEAWVFSLDDSLRRIAVEGSQIVGSPIPLGEFAVSAAWFDKEETKALVATGKDSLICVGASGVEWTKANAVPRRPTAIGVSAVAGLVAIGLERPEGMSAPGVQNTQFDLQLFNITDAGSPDGLTPGSVLQEHLKEVTSLKFTPAGNFLASADAGNKIFVWAVSGGNASVAITDFCLHTARITCLDWLPDGKHLVSGALDQTIFVWDVDKPKEYTKIAEAHKAGVTSVAACSDTSFASVGNDGFLKVYSLS